MGWFTQKDVGKTYKITLENNEEVIGRIEASDIVKIELLLTDGRIRKIKETKIEDCEEILSPERKTHAVDSKSNDTVDNIINRLEQGSLTYEGIYQDIKHHIKDVYFNDDINKLEDLYTIKDLYTLSVSSTVNFTNKKSQEHIDKLDDFLTHKRINLNTALIIVYLIAKRVHKNSLTIFHTFVTKWSHIFSNLTKEQLKLYNRINKVIEDREGLSKKSNIKKTVSIKELQSKIINLQDKNEFQELLNYINQISVSDLNIQQAVIILLAEAEAYSSLGKNSLAEKSYDELLTYLKDRNDQRYRYEDFLINAIAIKLINNPNKIHDYLDTLELKNKDLHDIEQKLNIDLNKFKKQSGIFGHIKNYFANETAIDEKILYKIKRVKDLILPGKNITKVNKPTNTPFRKEIQIVNKSAKAGREKFSSKADLFLFLQKNLKNNFSYGLETIKFNKQLILDNSDSFTNLVMHCALTSQQLQRIDDIVDLKKDKAIQHVENNVKKVDKVSKLFMYIQQNIKKDFNSTCEMIVLNIDLLENKKIEFMNLLKTSKITPAQEKIIEEKIPFDFSEIEELQRHIYPKIQHALRLAATGKEKELHEAEEILEDLYQSNKLPDSKLVPYLGILARRKKYDIVIDILEKQIATQENVSEKIKHIKQLSFYYQKDGMAEKALKVLYDAIENYEDINVGEKTALLSQIIFIKTKNNDSDDNDIEFYLQKIEALDPENDLRSKLTQFRKTQDGEKQIDDFFEQYIDYSTEFNNLDKFIEFYLDGCEYKGVSATKAKEKNFTEGDYKTVSKLDMIKSSREKSERTLTAVLIGKQLNLEIEEINTKLIESLRFQANYYNSQNRYDIAKNYLLTILYLIESSKKDDKYMQYIIVEYFKTALKVMDDMEFYDLLQKVSKQEETQNLIINLRLFSKKAFDYFYYKLQRKKELFDLYEMQFRINYLIDSDDLYQKIESDLKIIANKGIADDTIIPMLDNVNRDFFFELDKRYFSDFTKVFKEFQNIHTANSYEEKELILERCENQLEKLQQDIKAAPAIFSINNLLNLIGIFIKKVEDYSHHLKVLTLPKLTITTEMDTYVVDNGYFDFYLRIENEENSSPAKNISIKIRENEILVAEKAIPKVSGGKNETIAIGLFAEDIDTFAITTVIEYETVMETKEIVEKDFAISFEDSEEFEIINSPYSPDSDGVKDRSMVYGRDKLIKDISELLYKQNVKGVVLYGQKRSGKSTVFYWLQEEMKERNDQFFTIYFSMGTVDGFEGFIRNIVKRIKRDYKKIYAEDIFDYIDENERDIYDFTDLFDFLESVKEFLEERGLQLLILIDEFTYLYGYLKSGKYPESFLKNWKALIQEDLFKSALIGQNSMPLFINDYPNELAIYKKEKLSYLDRESAYLLIDEPIRLGDGTSRYKEGAIELIFEYTNGSPYYIQKVCDELVRYLNDKKSTYITTAHVKDVLSRLFQNMTLEGDFDNLLTLGDGASNEIENLRKEAIVSIALKSKHIGGVSYREIELACSDEIKQEILKSLLDTDVLSVSQNGRYSIIVRLLEKFIQYSYQGQM